MHKQIHLDLFRACHLCEIYLIGDGTPNFFVPSLPVSGPEPRLKLDHGNYYLVHPRY